MSGFLASSTFNNGSTATASIVLDFPAGVESGDFMLVHILQRGDSGSITPPSGWTLVRQSAYVVGGDAGMTFWTYRKVAGGSEPSSYTFTSSSSQYHGAVLTAYWGVSGVAASAGWYGLASAGSAFDAPTLSGTAGEILVCAVGLNDYGATFTPPSGMTEQTDLPGWASGIETSDVVLSSTGATGAKTVTYAGGPASWRSVAHSLTLVTNVAPNAPTLTAPGTGTTIDRAVTQRMDWTVSDPDPGDSQSKFDLRYRLGAAAWVTVSTTTPNSFHDFAPATFAAGSYEWQVRTYDALGVVGPYSTSSFFTSADSPGVPSITAPTNGSTVNATGSVTWSVGTQTHYQVRRVADLAGAADTGTVYYDSGEITSTGTRTLGLTFTVNARWEHIQVRVKAAGLWSSWADCRVQVSWTAPMVPTVTATPNSATASISIAVTNPAVTGGAPVTAYNDIYVSSALDPEYRAKTLMAPNSTWTWRTPAANRAYTITARAIGTNGTSASSV